jgi:hypothetical protein
MVMDTRDLFFQSHPFQRLPNPTTPPPPHELLFIEEIAPHSCKDPNPIRSFIAGNFRNRAHTVPCYGVEKYDTYSSRPVLCSGTVIGTRQGMHRFLSVLVEEFHTNNKKTNLKCQSPHTTDQWTMNWLYYNGKFGRQDKTTTLPWGTGPVLTVGKACMTGKRKQGASDLVPRDEISGLILNAYEDAIDSNGVVKGTKVIAPVVHQFDRCGKWIGEFFESHPNLFGARKSNKFTVDDNIMSWLPQDSPTLPRSGMNRNGRKIL